MALIYEKKEGIAYLTINRPEVHNALDPETVVELAEAWEDYKNDKSVLCAIITGAGDKTFCSGADLGKLIPLATGARTPENELERSVQNNPMFIQNAFLRDFELYKPVIAAINGQAIGGGMELIQATDIRVAAEHASFALQEVKWAIFPRGGSTVRLPRQIPFCNAMEILLTGERITAAEAYRLGFLNYVAPKEEVMEKAEAIARRIAQNGPLSVKAIKQSVLSCIGIPIRDGLMREAEIATPVFLSEDAREGPRAFKEKREPRYTGK